MKENVDHVKLLFDRRNHVTNAAREPDMHRKRFNSVLLFFKARVFYKIFVIVQNHALKTCKDMAKVKIWMYIYTCFH